MERFYKKFSLLIVFALFVSFFIVDAYAASSETYKAVTSVADFSFIEPEVKHKKIDTVLANGILNAKIRVDFGEAESAKAFL